MIINGRITCLSRYRYKYRDGNYLLCRGLFQVLLETLLTYENAMSYPSQAYNQPPPYGAAGQYNPGYNPGPAGAYNPPAGAYNPGPGPYQGSPAGAYQQPQQTTVYVYKDNQAERDREMAEDCCLLACCWATICCCLAANT